MNLDSVRLGLAGGVLFGLSMFTLTLLAMATGCGRGCLDVVATMYPGFDVTVGGSLLGLTYGFIHGFLSLFFLAWMYNVLGPRSDDEENHGEHI